MKALNFFLALALIFSMTAVPVFATGHFDIDVDKNGGGITIKPGDYPDLGGEVGDLQDQIATKVTSKAKSIAQVITGICSLICFTVLLVNITRLSQKAGDPKGRSSALTGILWSGIAIALFGGSYIIVTFFWNFLT